jgi:hypothetical protein
MQSDLTRTACDIPIPPPSLTFDALYPYPKFNLIFSDMRYHVNLPDRDPSY